jgi:nucleoside-diphosphate-sugar epimerase
MVVGNGLIAKAFKSYIDNSDILIFASGVSNSKCENNDEFNREFKLIEKNINYSGLFVYFSTCSISDPTLQNSQYINHKIKMEAYISSKCDNFLIVRLPNIIGNTKNPHTFTNYFYNSILNGNTINIQKNAYRYFVEINDVANILNQVFTQNNNFNQCINLIVVNKVKVIEVLRALEAILNKKANYNIVDGESDYTIEPSQFLKEYISNDFYASNTYLKSSLTKHYISH